MTITARRPRTRSLLPPPSVGRLRSGRSVSLRLLAIVVATLGGAALIAGAAGSYSLFIWQLVVVYMLFAASVNFLFGIAGVFSFGQAAVLGTGGYATALVSIHAGIEGPLALLFGGLAAAALSVVVGTALNRVSGVAFAIVTLAASEILQQLTFRVPALRGEDGLSGVAAGSAFGIALDDPERLWWYAAFVLAVGLVALYWVQESRLGHALRSVRDDAELARSTGIGIVSARLVAFVIAGFFGGVAGGLLAQVQLTITPEVFHFSVSGLVVVMCLVGGLRWFVGPLIGAAAYIWAEQQIAGESDNRLLYTGLALLIVVLVAPDGLAGVTHRLFRRVVRGRERKAVSDGD